MVDWLSASPTAPMAVFVHGLASDRQGEKALFFQQEFGARGWSFLRLDLRGHGESDGNLAEMTVSRALADMETALSWCLQQRQPEAPLPLLIGSSMGAALVAWYQGELKIGSGGPLVLLSPALDFPHCIKSNISSKRWKDWQKKGILRLDSDWEDILLGWQLIEDSYQYPFKKLLQKWQGPALLIHGIADEVIPWEKSTEFLRQCPEKSLQLLLLKDGDHRLNMHKEQIFNTMWQWLQQLSASPSNSSY